VEPYTLRISPGWDICGCKRIAAGTDILAEGFTRNGSQGCMSNIKCHVFLPVCTAQSRTYRASMQCMVHAQRIGDAYTEDMRCIQAGKYGGREMLHTGQFEKMHSGEHPNGIT